MSDGLNGGPRPPDGDWLGTPFLRFEREGAFAICTLDRPQARNAMTPAMYFGIRYAISRVNADPDLAGLLITGTGDVFAPGGDLGQAAEDNWMDFAATMGMDVTPFDVLRQSPKPVVSAVNGSGSGWRSADRHVQRPRRGQRSGHLPGARVVPRHRRHLLQPGVGAPDRPGPHEGPDVHRPDVDRAGGPRLGHGGQGGSARRPAGCGERTSRAMLPNGPGGAGRGQGQPGQLPGPVRPDRDADQHLRSRGARRLPRVQGEELADVGAPRASAGRPVCSAGRRATSG